MTKLILSIALFFVVPTTLISCREAVYKVKEATEETSDATDKAVKKVKQ